MSEERKIENTVQDIDTEKLIKGYVDTVFNIWRMGKDVKLHYEDNKKKLDNINEIIDNHLTLSLEVDEVFVKINKKFGLELKFVDDFDFEKYKNEVENRKRSLEKTLIPLKNLSKKYDRTLKILQKNGFQIMEFDNREFSDGMSLRVLGYDTRSDIEEDIIIETVKPSIFFNGKEYLKGEVIVSKKPDDE